MSAVHHLPRLYVDADLTPGTVVDLGDGPSHYLKTVMRRKAGDAVRVFDGRVGEFLAHILPEPKGNDATPIQIDDLIRPVPATKSCVQVIFPPLKKDALDVLIEKSVELGATDFFPVTTDQADVRALNPSRIQAQIIESAEQCESLIMPRLHPLHRLEKLLATWPDDQMIIAAIERVDAPLFRSLPRTLYTKMDVRTILVGPAGGFSKAEKNMLLNMPRVQAVSLGDRILRAETAVIAMLSALHLKGENHDV